MSGPLVRILNGLKAAEALYPKVAPRAPKISDRARIVTNEIIDNRADPTTLFQSPDGDILAAYQLSKRDNGTYLPNIVSYVSGNGAAALEHAYQNAPSRPVHLYAIPGSEGFYRKQPGWEESTEEGVSKFIRKARGGAVAKQTQPYEHTRSSTQDKSIEQMDAGALNALKRGVQMWGPDLLGMVGDAGDALRYVGQRAMGKNDSNAGVGGMGPALRRFALEGARAAAPRRAQTEMTTTEDPDMRTEAVRFVNPLMWGNPLKTVNNPVMGALAGAFGGVPMGGLGVIKNKGGNWLSGSVEDALKGLKKFPQQYSPEEWAKAEEILRKSASGEIQGMDTAASTRNLNDFLGRRAIDSFIDKQLTRYVKNEMATPEDPIRALAERGVLHFDPNEVAQARRTVHPSGEVPRTMGESPLARAWEQTSDNFIAPETAGRFKVTLGQDGTTTVSRNPWLEKLPNDAIVHDVYESSRPSQLGFDHLTDELANALNPESGLPRHLLLDPNSLPRVSVPQAVERVAQINAWRAAQKAEADALRANNAATVLHKEYPVSDYWHGGDYVPGSDLTRPLYVAKNKALAESYVGMSKDRTGKGSLVPLSHSAKSPAPEDVVVEEARKLGIDVDNYTPASIFDSELHGEGVVSALVRRLKAKGYDSANLHDIGYGTQVDDVATVLFPGVKTNKGYDNPKGLRWVELRNPDKIDLSTVKHDPSWESPDEAFLTYQGGKQALQDALKYEGDTMGHCVGGYCDDVASGRSRIYSLRDAKGQPHVTIEVEPSLNTTTIEQNGKLVEVPDPGELPRIKQIKGKQNRAPNAEYLPFVQDFVKSGKWSDVGDLQNSGLLDISKLKGGYSLGMRDADYQILGDALRKRDPNMRSVSQTLADALPPDAANYMTREELFRYLGVEGFAHGGPVQTKPFSISDLQAIIASLRQEHINA